MEGVTDFVFRELVATHLPRPDVFFTEFTSSDGLASPLGYSKTVARFKFSEIQRPIVAQIWGNKPKNLMFAANVCRELGFDGVDINMGCPDRKVLKSGCGAAMCTNFELATECIQATKEGAKGLPVSVKTRLGLKKIITEEWIGHLLKHELSALIIHGRTASQKSETPANWNEIQKGVMIRADLGVNTIIVGNGDISDRIQGESYCQKYNVDGVMIGRGIFTNPWAFESKKEEHSALEHVRLLQKHLTLYQKESKNENSFDSTKKFAKMYIRNFTDSSTFRERIMQTKNVEDALNLVSELENKLSS